MTKKRISIKSSIIIVLLLAMPLAAQAQHDNYIHMFWNQHQPSYIDGITGKFKHQFTRVHALTSYYWMAAVLIDGRNDINTYEIQNNTWVDTGQVTGYGYPFVHQTINLSGILIEQLDHYVKSLAPAFDGATTASEILWNKYPGGSPLDPDWQDGTARFEMNFDLLCKPQANLSLADKRYLLDHTIWIKPVNGFITQWPAYRKLYHKRLGPGGGNPAHWTDDEMRDLKFWYNLTVFHPYFKETNDYILRGHDEQGNEITDHVTRIKEFGQFKTWGDSSETWFGETGETLDPSDMGGYSWGSGQEFDVNGVLCRHFTDEDCWHLALMQYKVMKYVIPIHRKLQNTTCPHSGFPQLEVVTTPFSHPILPLVYDTDTYLEQSDYQADRVDAIDFNYHGQGEGAPGPYGPDANMVFDDDAYNQVALGRKFYEDHFGRPPNGMWPGEGSVGESVIYAFRRNGIKYIMSGNETGEKSGHHDDNGRMYRIDEDSTHLDGDNSDAMSICFRSESDLIGFNGGYYYGGWSADGDAKAFYVMENHIITDWGHTKFWTHTADGENPWGYFHRVGATFMEYTHKEDGSPNYGLYYRINRACSMLPDDGTRWYVGNNVISATPSSFIGIRNGQYSGDGVEGLDLQWELEPLAHGSWVYGTLDTWMGEDNEIQGWIHLKQTREDLVAINAHSFRPDPYGEKPTPWDRDTYFKWMIWHEIYAAESSDTFWWYGADQSFGSDEIFDDLFRERLINAYVFARKLGLPMRYPFMQRHPIFSPENNVNNHHPGGAEYDEDYLYDSEPPPGHGEIIRIPPLTSKPQLTSATLPANGRDSSILTIYVWEEGLEATDIKEVTVDLRELGGLEKHPLYDDGDFLRHGDFKADDGTYSTYITVPQSVPAGDYLLTITAMDNSDPPGVSMEPIVSLDYTVLTVEAQYGPELLLGGYYDTALHSTTGGKITFIACTTDQDDQQNIEVEVFYQGTPTGVTLSAGSQTVPIAGVDVFSHSLSIPGGVAPANVLLEMMASDSAGNVSKLWPYLVVE